MRTLCALEQEEDGKNGAPHLLRKSTTDLVHDRSPAQSLETLCATLPTDLAVLMRKRDVRVQGRAQGHPKCKWPLQQASSMGIEMLCGRIPI